MKVTVIPADRMIVIDGEGLQFDFSYYPPGLRALQWNHTSGSMEFETGANQFIDNPALVQPYIDQYQAEAERIAAEAAAAGGV